MLIFPNGIRSVAMNWSCPDCGDELEHVYSTCVGCGFVPPQGAD